VTTPDQQQSPDRGEALVAWADRVGDLIMDMPIKAVPPRFWGIPAEEGDEEGDIGKMVQQLLLGLVLSIRGEFRLPNKTAHALMHVGADLDDLLGEYFDFHQAMDPVVPGRHCARCGAVGRDSDLAMAAVTEAGAEMYVCVSGCQPADDDEAQ
jgi:hypothetical protein